ncbi:ABC-type nickel/cobalt efflux system, permease component RcnA [Marinospirillum celere]|uniref:Nickel/cobalt efflux system n=1 Tax=Marinospirillum celere TaxID=1122252 RepID=A0A1I1I5K2_9GAMM|nr:hypothetical protein [Marinospirillum celere]SFC31361.1 ABC-type nickel/cobalt efflux system, permease component RcnA [Marinospirillum celere]
MPLIKTLLLLFFLLFSTAAQATPLPGSTGTESRQEQQLSQQGEQQVKKASYWQQFNHWVLQKQRDFHRQLTSSIEAIQEQASWQTAGALLLISFGYGVFHAAGPGHGKAVLTAYLVTQPEKLRRGLVLSFLASLLQGLTAILLVTLLVHLLGRLAREAFSSVLYVEMLSFAVVALLGLGLLLTALRRLFRQLKQTYQHRQEATSQLSFQPVMAATSSGLAPLGSSPGACPSCGKVHHVAPEQAEGKSRLQTLGLLLSIGLRPCSGAVLVLVVANLLGLWWIGVGSVMVMALGTSITVMTLAVLAVKTRDLAYHLLGLQGTSLAWVSITLGALGGLFILFLGVTLMLGVTATRHPLGIV